MLKKLIFIFEDEHVLFIFLYFFLFLIYKNTNRVFHLIILKFFIDTEKYCIVK